MKRVRGDAMRRTTVGIGLAAAALVAGCATPISGTPTPVGPGGPAATTSSAAPDPVAGLAWTTVTDTATGTSAELPGPATPEQRQLPNADPDLPVVQTTVFQAATARTGTVQLIIIRREPNGVFDHDREVRQVVEGTKGTLTDNRPVTVDGHSGVDYTVTYNAEASGKPSVVHVRFVEAKAFAIRLTTRGVNKDPAEVAAVHRRVADSLRVPAP